jgi:hypothetical protein
MVDNNALKKDGRAFHRTDLPACAPTATFDKIRNSDCFRVLDTVQSRLTILHGGFNFSESEGIMLQTDITILKERQKVLAKEIDEALSHAPIDDPMIAYLKSRILYVTEEIDRLRHEAFVSYH